MADDNKLWFEMGVRDKVTEHITEIITQAAVVQKEMDAITASQRAAYQNAAKLEQVYDKIAIAMQRIGDARSLTNDSNKLRKLNEMEAALKRMKAAFEEIENNETKMGLKGTVALEQLKQGFQLMTSQVARFANEIENTSKKESKAHDDEIRRQDKLKSKLYELQNLRKKLSDSILEAPAGYDTSVASKIAGQLWSKEMQVSRYLRNGREVPLDFFGAEYSELKRQAEEYSRTITRAHREATSAIQQNAKANQQLVSTYDQVIEKSKGTNSVLRQMEIQLASTFSLYGAEHLLKSVIQIGGEFEQQHIALQNILGDVEEANTLFNQIQTLAVVSPFNFRQLTSYAKQTAAYGVPYEELYDTTKRLADLSAGLGVDMGRLILAYGQVRSASVLRGQELRQFTEAGIPLVQKLADKFTELNGRVVTTGEVFELISKRKVPFEMVKEILWDMTNAGGSFYQMQFKLSDTLLGKWSNLQDAWEIMLSKFAEGGSTGGDILKSLVQGATDLIESLDRLSPILTGVVGGVGLSKLTNLATGNILNTEKAILEAKKLEASRLRRDALTRSLSEREQEILNTSNKITVNDIKALASAGRLNTLKLQQLYVNKQLTQADVARLVNEKAITVEQGAQIANATRLKVVFGSLRATISNIASGFMSMVTSPAFLMTAGISAALSLFATWKDAENERKEIAESVGNSILDQYNQILKVQQDISKSNPSTDGEYLKGINEMTETLKSIGAYSGDIDNQARSIENLADRYAYLKSKVDEAAVAYENLARHAQTSTEYSISMTDGWFDESIITNMKDLTNTLDDFDKAAIGVQRFGSIIQAEIEKIANLKGNEILKNQLDGKSLEEELKIIAESKYWSQLTNMVGLTSNKAEIALRDFGKEYHNVLADWNTITGEDLPAFIQGIEDSFKREHPDIDLTNLDDEMKLELKRFVHQALTEVDGVRQDIKDRLEQDIDAHFKINVDFELSIATPPDYWRVKYPVLNQLLGKLGDKGLNYDNSFYNSIGEAGGATSSDKLWKYMDSQVDDLKKKWEAEEKLYGTASEQAIKAKNSYENMQKARDAAFGGSLKDAMKSGGKGSKKDTVLEGWKIELKELREFWREYETLAKRMSDKATIETIRKGGVFPSMFDKDGNLLVNVREGLSKALRNFLTKTNVSTTDRKKFQDEILKSIFDVDNKAAEEAAKKMLDQVREAISRQAEQWNLYKEILNKTGNKKLATTAFSDGKVWDDQARSMAESLKKQMEDNLSDGGVIRIDWDAEEKTAEEYFKKNFKNGEALFEIWKAIVGLVRGNYVTSLKESADAISTLMSEEEKIKKIEQEIKDLKEKKDVNGKPLYNENSPEIIAKEKELANVRANAYEKTIEYAKFYSGILSMTVSEAEKVGAAIKKNLVEQLKDGNITADKFMKSIKNVDEQLKKARQGKNYLNAFKSGGLQGVSDLRLQIVTDELSAAAAEAEEAEKELTEARLKAANATTDAERAETDKEILEAKKRKGAANQRLETANKNYQAALRNNIATTKFGNALSGISMALDAMVNGYHEWRQLATSFGEDLDANMSSFGQVYMSVLEGLQSGISKLQQGDFVGAITSLTTGIIGGIAQKHDATLKQDIKLSEEVIKRYDNIVKLLEKRLDSILGSVYALAASETDLKKLYDYMGKIDPNLVKKVLSGKASDKELEEWMRKQFLDILTYGAVNTDGTGVERKIASDTKQAITTAIESGSYYDTKLAQMYIQRDELMRQLKDQEDMKEVDDGKIEDYKQQIAELEEDIKTFAQDMAKALYDIDLKSWASQLGDALFDAWQKGESGAEAFRKKASEIIMELSKKIAVTKLIETALSPVLDTIESEMKRTNGKLDDKSIEALSQGMTAVSETLPDAFNTLMDGLNEGMKKAGLEDMKSLSEESSSSTSSTIKGVTENTADLLASYINAIRADVSVNRVTLTQILLAVQTQSEMPVIARAQLAQLQQIVINTGRNAEVAEMIYDLLHSVAPDGTYLKIK